MGEVLAKLIDRISTYEILNNIIPGSVYIALIERLTPLKIQCGKLWTDIVISYFLGLVIGRIGSLLVAPCLRWLKVLDPPIYPEYMKAEKDSRVCQFSMISNMYRSFTAVALCLLATLIGLNYTSDMETSKYILKVLGCLVLIVLFTLSYRKQDKYLTSRIKAVNDLKIQDGNS